MPSQSPRVIPTLALAALWLALYFVWVAVRPTAEPTTATTTKGRAAVTSSTTTTSPALFKLKP